MTDKKVLIFIVAYHAESTIAQVLERIPADALPPGTDVLVIDDESSDRTFEEALRRRETLGPLHLTVLSNPVNQGYGGNQKLGYRYAIEHGYDAVALLHGDAQYAPEKLPELIGPILRGEAEACFGSRMLERGGALRGGMPLYKYIGNRILTGLENRLLGMHLSEFHSGYRAYAVDALRQVPFQYNTNDFHFDTEIIIQFHLRHFRIAEVPIPTFYGDEVCRVNGCVYGWHVIMAALASRLHGMGLFFRRKFDVAGDAVRRDAKLGYPSSHTLAIEAVPAGASVLELGCGSGSVAQALKRKGCRVTGVDAGEPAQDGFAAFYRQSLEAPAFPAGLGPYDFILVLDRLEHLASPEDFLMRVRRSFYAAHTTLIMTAPNVGFFMVRLGLLLGQFNYGRQGILDLTHKRLFTFGSFRRTVEQEGYRVRRMRGIPAPFPKALGGGRLSRALLALNRLLIAVSARWFAYQIYVEAAFVPPLDRLLARTVEASRDRGAPGS
ncbi:MAG: glycosyltransferase [Lentisphaerae bacterium]|nr:glycosyltransferase [Lentisphaerota bacterium]